MLAISLDHLASRYHLLPSEAMTRATTFDLQVLDVGARWAQHQHNLANGINESQPAPSTEELQAMMDRVRQPK